MRTPIVAKSAIVLTVLVLLLVVLRFWRISSYSLWGGEAFTMIGVQQSWRGMFAYIVADVVHPPLFYVLLRLWTGIGGDSLLWLKLFPVLTGVAVVGPFLFLCRELNFRPAETNLALLMLAVNGYLIHYAQELRMYSLLTFLAVCSFWLFIRLHNSPEPAARQLVLLTVVNLLATYTHYYGWVVVGLEFFFLLVWRRQRAAAFGLSALFLLLCFAPWAYLVVKEAHAIGGLAQNLDWISKPGLNDVLHLYATFNGPLGNRYVKLFGLALFGLPLLFWGWRVLCARFGQRKDVPVRFSWLALLAFLPVTALFLVSQRMEQAVWIDRYFIFVAIPYMMLVAAAVYQIRPPRLRNLWMVAIVVWSLLAGFNDLRTNRMAWESPQLGSRVDWDGIVRSMIATEGESSGPISVYALTVVSKGNQTGDWAIATSVGYSMALQGDDRLETIYARDVYDVLEQAEEDRFWVGFFELAEWPQPSPPDVLAANGYHLGEPLVFHGQRDRLVLLPVRRE